MASKQASFQTSFQANKYHILHVTIVFALLYKYKTRSSHEFIFKVV